MRQFWSYGPVDENLHYCAPRKELTANAFTRLTGEVPEKGGQYITVWAPRQCGKTSLMVEVYQRLLRDPRFNVVPVSLQNLSDEKDTSVIIANIAERIGEKLGKNFSGVDTQEKFQEIFKKEVLEKPLILILDEFDALGEHAISTLVSAFRNIHIERGYEKDKPISEKSHLLHAVALVGVRSVLGVQNKTGSPFNVQQSLHISNLTYNEVKEMFRWYEKESGQKVEEGLLRQLYYETRGQPGFIGWFGELLTETYQRDINQPLGIDNFKEVYAAANHVLPNNNILNIISKAKTEPYKDTVLELFKTDRKIKFTYGDPNLNFLYMNGVIDKERIDRDNYYVRFSSPFVQKSLFNYFSESLFRQAGQLVEPFVNLDDTITETHLDIPNLANRYQEYLTKNKKWLLEDVPRRNDLRVFEAVYHFSFYSYLDKFLEPWNGRVIPEFPTGNGKVDLLIEFAGQRFGLELKSFSTDRNYKDALVQAARYANQLEMETISLIFFVEKIDSKSRQKYQKEYRHTETAVKVKPIFVETGN